MNISLPLCQNLIIDIFQFLNLASEAKAKEYSFKAKDTISWPRGQGHGLEDSISDSHP